MLVGTVTTAGKNLAPPAQARSNSPSTVPSLDSNSFVAAEEPITSLGGRYGYMV